MSLITTPTGLHFSSVSASYEKVRARSVSPFTKETQTYIWPGSLYSFTFTVPPVKDQTAARAIVKFLRDLANGDNWFSWDVSRYVPTDEGSPMLLCLSDPTFSWSIDVAMFFGISFKVEQYKGVGS